MPAGFEDAGRSEWGRPLVFFEGDELAAWDVPPSAGFEQFTAFLALDADRYTDHEIVALGQRLRAAGMVYVCSWGPGCVRVHHLVDLVYIEEERSGSPGPYLMTDAHDDEPLAYGLWYALHAMGEDVKDPRTSAVVIGADRDDWRREIRSWLGDVEALNRCAEDVLG